MLLLYLFIIYMVYTYDIYHLFWYTNTSVNFSCWTWPNVFLFLLWLICTFIKNSFADVLLIYIHINATNIYKHEKQFPHVNRVFDFTDRKKIWGKILQWVYLYYTNIRVTRVYSNILCYLIVCLLFCILHNNNSYNIIYVSYLRFWRVQYDADFSLFSFIYNNNNSSVERGIRL